MIRLSTIINTFEASLLERYGHRLSPDQRQALSAIKTCRSAFSPRMQVQCDACDEQRFVPHSCGHRSCPHCQHHENQQWLERQLKKTDPRSLLSADLNPICRASCFVPITSTYSLQFDDEVLLGDGADLRSK